MPEIKNVFRQGVMNKDDDERIIPNGQYRDAMNVEVSTSEDSDVGTVQNILGNEVFGIDKFQSFYDTNLKCIGAIADEKNDVFYYFLIGDNKSFIIELDHFENETLVFVDTKGILGFNKDNIITGINIIDDLLFYTTNENEPKKINIKSCKQGTTGTNTHTQLVVDSVGQGDIELENITVIKKRPTKSPDVIFKESSIQPLISLGEINFFGLNIQDTISNIQIGDDNNIINPPPFSVNDIVIISLNTNSLTALIYDVKLRVLTAAPQLGTTIPLQNTTVGTLYSFEILEINGVRDDDFLQEFSGIKKVDIENIFEREFIRFATRYKFVDGEYSAFSPFTQPVFLCGRFGFHPTKDPYNLGMENKTINILLNNLVETNAPKDVVQVDILFKKERSTTIYTIDSIRPDDPGAPNKWNTNDFPNDAILSWSGSSLQSSSTEGNPTGQYEITVENIYAAVPENQMLRPYDNVPRKALAQEITGNRLVFANYVQNFDMVAADGTSVKQEIQVDREQRSFDFNGTVNFPENRGKKSIKSLRTYYLGVVYGDEFGRETPVFTSKDASINIPFDNESSGTNDFFNPDKSLRLKAKLSGQVPSWATYFKYYIKQTTGEYYNLTMDRVYKTVGDENLWVSFPSSDRNKIQEGDYFSIKKQVDLEQIVPIENKIKIIDIKNEAPDSIRYNYQNLGTYSGDLTALETLFDDASSRPRAGATSFVVDQATYIASGGIDIEQLSPSERIAVQFTITSPNGNGIIKSKIYLVTAFSTEGTSPTGSYNITLKEKIEDSDSWIVDANNDLNATDGLTFSILKVTEKDATEFEGRFFVKIISSAVTQQYLIPATQDANNFSITSVIAYTNQSNTLGGANGINPNTCENTTLTTTVAGFSDTESEFDTITNNVVNTAQTGWFIDSLGFVAAQQDDPTSFDADRSGKMYKGNPAASVNQYVNGLEGVVSFTPGQSSNYNQSGAGSSRTWSNNAYRLQDGLNITNVNNYNFVGNTGGYTQTYNSNNSPAHFLHLSFMAPGVDLHDGNFNAIDNHFDGIGIINSQSWKDLYDALFSEKMLDRIYAENIYQRKLVQGPGLTNVAPNVFRSYLLQFYLPAGGATFDADWGYVFTSGGQPNQMPFTPVGANLGLGNISSTNTDWTTCFDPGYNNTGNTAIINNLDIGKKFTIEGDDNTTYTILRVTKHLLYNHTAWNPILEYDFSTNPPTKQNEYTTGNYTKSVAVAMQRFADHFAANGGNPDISCIEYHELKQTIANFGRANNRRVTYVLELDKDPRLASSSTSIFTSNNVNNVVPSQLNFVEDYLETGSNTMPISPAIFETEAKEEVDLNVYYEASDNLPLEVQPTSADNRGHLLAPVGTKVISELIGADPTDWDAVNDAQGTTNLFLKVRSWNGNYLNLTPPGLVHGVTGLQTSDYIGSKLRFVREDGSYMEATISNIIAASGKIYSLYINSNTFNEYYGLPYYNCFSFGNGVESNRIRDDFNESFILNGVKASTVLEEQYAEEHRKYGLIYSGLYNSISGLNNLNQFIQAEKITKDVNPTFGSIQKLYSRTKDLVTLCEDKVLQIFVDRDLLFNADGNEQLLASNRFLGTVQPFRGNYGISKNPESFAAESFRAYFTDKQRGAVLRLSIDGLTPISDAGMTDYFRDKLPNYDVLYGSYDAYKGDYNLTLRQGENTRVLSPLENKTITYNEKSKGWVSFKSFIPEIAISSVKQYYSFDKGQSFKHHVNINRNNFYNNFEPSTITPVLNARPELVKHFNTLNYEGTQAKVDVFTTDPTTGLTDGQYYNLQEKKGWFVESIFTNKQEGAINEFIEKEGKWFNYIKGTEFHIDPAAFNFQGLGIVDNVQTPPPPIVLGCTDPNANNYDPNATQDDGSCTYLTPVCLNPNALNYTFPFMPLTQIEDNSLCNFALALQIRDINPNISQGVLAGSAMRVVTIDSSGTFSDTPQTGDGWVYSWTVTQNGVPYTIPSNTTFVSGTGPGPVSVTLTYTPSGQTYTLTGTISENVVPGCTNPNAPNYNFQANSDDGSCVITSNPI